MPKMLIAKVRGYKLEGRSVGSFKLNLRYSCKENILYFTPVDKFVKNLGQLLFGVPDKWKGLFEMEYKEDKDKSDIMIYLDYRINLVQEYIEKIKDLIHSGLDVLKREGLIEDYIFID